MSLQWHEFVRRFRLMVALSSVSGLYIPGAQILLFKKKSNFFVIYSIVFNVIVLTDSVDWLLTAIIHFDEKPAIEIFYLFMMAYMYLWAAVNSMYFIIHREDVKMMIKFWNDLDPKLWPELRNQIIEEEYYSSKKKYGIMIVCLWLPYTLLTIFQTIKGRLIIASMWAYSPNTIEAPRYGVFLNCVPIICFMMSYCTYVSFLTLVQRLLLAELKYLHLCLQRIMNEYLGPIDYGVTNSNGFEVNMNSIHSMISMFVRYHAKVLKFGNQVKTLYRILALLQFLFIALNLCGISFCSTTGIMPLDTSIFTFAFVGFLSIMYLLSCQLGDEIYQLSFSLGDVVFHNYNTKFPRTVQKATLMITLISKSKPLVIRDSAGLCPLVSKSYLELIMLQYKFFRFMADMRKK